MNNKILVTGGQGFIGSHLVDALCAQGYLVTVVDHQESAHHDVRYHRGIELVLADFADPKILTRLKKGEFSTCFHLAAQASVPVSFDKPLVSHEDNLTKTLEVVLSCAISNTKFIFASTSAVYGNKVSLPTSEDSRLDPVSPYAVQKLSVEHYCKVWQESAGLKYVALRFFNVFGPRQSSVGAYPNVICAWATSVNKTRTIEVHGTGTQSRDFVFVHDVVDALMKVSATDKCLSKTFNVGSGDFKSLLELQTEFENYFGKFKVVKFPSRPGDVKATWADIGHLQNHISFNPREFKPCLVETFNWYMDNP